MQTNDYNGVTIERELVTNRIKKSNSLIAGSLAVHESGPLVAWHLQLAG